MESSEMEIESTQVFFREHDEFFVLLDKVLLSTRNNESWISDGDSISDEKINTTRMIAILEQYQEQPTCLDPYLERVIGEIMNAIREFVYAFQDQITDDGKKSDDSATDVKINSKRMRGLFELVYVLCKVRGYKIVMKFFPHEVVDVEPAFSLLWHHTKEMEPAQWTSRYILLIWLSLLTMIPFDIASIDSGVSHLPNLECIESPGNTLADRWISLAKYYLRRPGCEMEGAAVMLSRLLTRKDIGDRQEKFFEWAIGEIDSIVAASELDSKLTIPQTLRINGVLRVLCNLFRMSGSNDIIESYTGKLIDLFHLDIFKNSSLARKFVAKAAQRLALIYLPHAPVAARQTHIRSLVENLTQNSTSTHQHTLKFNGVYEDTGDIDIQVPDVIEPLIGVLLQSLNDKDTIIRWSAAKGIGRIAVRLPEGFAHEIAVAILSILKEETAANENGTIDVSMTSEYSWHGALLCLAELARRDLLSKDIMRDAIPWIIRGLTYDIQRGDFSVGSNVRDAACYVMWSFARIHNKETKYVFDDFKLEMATALISVAVFDRESNVRRAASAAFQEHVGRHSAFPHGIQVLQLANFFSVGNTRNAFTSASIQISQYSEYCEPLLLHLCTITIYHWDVKIRELSAEALCMLAPLAPDFVIDHILSGIIKNTTSPFLAIRHGAIIATGVIAQSLSRALKQHPKYSKEIIHVINEIPQRYLDDFGSSLTLAAMARYIGSLSLSNWPIDKELGAKFFDIFVAAFTQCTEYQTILPYFREFVDAYGITDKQHKRIVEYTKVERVGNGSREGFVLALGALSEKSDFDLLCNLITIPSTIPNVSIEMRRNAAMALGSFYLRAHKSCASRENDIEDVVDTVQSVKVLVGGLDDHTIDNRGDVGSWVRKQCLESLGRIFIDNPDALNLINEELGAELFGKVLRATTEKIDKLRISAGHLLTSLLYSQRTIPVWANNVGIDKLSTYIPRDAEPSKVETGPNIRWDDPEAAYRQVSMALSSGEKLRRYLFEGFVLAGSAEPLGKYAVNAIADYAEELSISEGSPAVAGGWSVDGIVEELTRLLLTDKRTSKIINPTLLFTDQLLEKGAFLSSTPDIWIPFYRAIQRIAYKLRAPRRLLLCLKLYESLSVISIDLLKMSSNSLLAHLAHPISKVRQAAADHLFSALCIHHTIADTEIGSEIEQILTETEWTSDNSDLNDCRLRLSKLMQQVITCICQ